MILFEQYINLLGFFALFLRVTDEEEELRQFDGRIARYFSGGADFRSREMLVATWDGVGYYNSKADRVRPGYYNPKAERVRPGYYNLKADRVRLGRRRILHLFPAKYRQSASISVIVHRFRQYGIEHLLLGPAHEVRYSAAKSA